MSRTKYFGFEASKSGSPGFATEKVLFSSQCACHLGSKVSNGKAGVGFIVKFFGTVVIVGRMKRKTLRCLIKLRVRDLLGCLVWWFYME